MTTTKKVTFQGYNYELEGSYTPGKTGNFIDEMPEPLECELEFVYIDGVEVGGALADMYVKEGDKYRNAFEIFEQLYFESL